jgi:hypothetical protein
MNHLRVTQNIFKSLRKVSKGGAGLPHNDPPNFKTIKNKRYVYSINLRIPYLITHFGSKMLMSNITL